MSAPDSDSPAYSIAPVFGAPLLLAEGKERLLIASDLHLGLEHELWLGGVSIPSQTRKILALLKGYLDMTMPDRLLILGDLKHNVPKTSWQEKREVPDFLRQLSAQVRVDIVSGNHDSNLADMALLESIPPLELCGKAGATFMVIPGRRKRSCVLALW